MAKKQTDETTPNDAPPETGAPAISVEYVKLANEDVGFIDPDTRFDISRSQVRELKPPVGTMTARLIASGALIKVSGPAEKSE
jgi:hypothetical protein